MEVCLDPNHVEKGLYVCRPRNGISPPPHSIQTGHFDLLAIDKEFAIIRGKRINAIQGHDRFSIERWRPRKDQVDLTFLPPCVPFLVLVPVTNRMCNLYASSSNNRLFSLKYH